MAPKMLRVASRAMARRMKVPGKRGSMEMCGDMVGMVGGWPLGWVGSK